MQMGIAGDPRPESSNITAVAIAATTANGRPLGRVAAPTQLMSDRHCAATNRRLRRRP